MAYSYDQIFAADPSNPGNVAANASVLIFEPGDPTLTPLLITDPSGAAIPNPVTVNANGFGPAFRHATLDRVAWDGGGFSGFFTSYEGMKDEAVAARTAAEAAEANAEAAASNAAAGAAADLAARITAGEFNGAPGVPGANGSNVLPTQEAIEQAIINPGPAKSALDARYVLKDRLIYNVMDHGAVGDGVTDDQPAIQALIDQINADATIEGAALFFPANTYAIGSNIDLPTTTNWSTTFMAKPIRLLGAGRSATKLKAIGAAASFDAVIRHQPPAPSVTGGAPHMIAEMTIDSNKVAKRNIDLINAHSVRVRDIYGLNPALGAYSNIRIAGQGTDYLSWENVIGPAVRLEGGGGIDSAQWSDHNLEVLSTDNHILSSTVLVRAKVANGVDQGGNNFWTGVHAFYGPCHFWQKGTFGSTFTHCEADGPDLYGFRLEGNNNEINGNRIFWPGGAVPSGLVAGIYLEYPILNSIITGNVIPDAPASKKVVSATRVDITTTIASNPGASLDTGPNPQATNYSAQYGDALTTTTGNTRGAGAFDGQFVRNSAAQVASGAQSVAFGYGNTSSASASVALGSLNTSNGFASEATGSRAHTRGTNGKRARSAGRFSVDGDQQKGEHIVSASTTSTTKTQLTIGNGGVAFANVVAMPAATSAYLATIRLVGVKTSGTAGETGYWTITALFRRLASGSSSIVKLGSPTWTAGQGDTLAMTAVPDLTAEPLYGHIGVHITAPDTGTWHWVATIDTVEVA